MDVGLKQKIINRIAHAGENPLFVCVSGSEVVRAGLEGIILMEDRHTVPGSFWHESINNIVSGSINPLGGFLFVFSLFFLA